jgi:hypothetical protein
MILAELVRSDAALPASAAGSSRWLGLPLSDSSLLPEFDGALFLGISVEFFTTA